MPDCFGELRPQAVVRRTRGDLFDKPLNGLIMPVRKQAAQHLRCKLLGLRAQDVRAKQNLLYETSDGVLYATKTRERKEQEMGNRGAREYFIWRTLAYSLVIRQLHGGLGKLRGP